MTGCPKYRRQRRTRHLFRLWHSNSFRLCAIIMRGSTIEMWRGLYWIERRRYWLAIHLRETLNTWWVATLLTVLSQFQTWITLKNRWPYPRWNKGKDCKAESIACNDRLCCYSQVFLALHRFVSLVADVMFVKNIPLLIPCLTVLNIWLFNTSVPVLLRSQVKS